MRKRIIGLLILLFCCGVAPRQKAMKILQEGVKDKSVIVRINAAKGLAQIGDTQGVKILYEILGTNQRDAVVASLSALNDFGLLTLSPIVAQLAQSNDPLIRTEVYRLIVHINDVACRNILIKGIDDKIAKIRRLSYLGLEKFNEKNIIRDGLWDIDPLVRIYVAKTLANLGEKEMANFIRRELQSADIEIWKQGIIALAEIDDTSAIPLIKGLFKDTPWELRIEAAEALLIFNDLQGLGVLKEGLHAQDPFIRIEAVRVFKEHQVPEAFLLLKEVVRDEYINVSIGAIEALAQYPSEDSKKLFIEMMDAPNNLIKIAAATAYLRS